MALENPEIIAPDKCNGCGLDLETIVKDHGGFLCFPALSVVPGGLIMIYGVVFHCCPACGAVMVNKNFAQNQKKLNDEKVKKILVPRTSSLIVPGSVIGKH